jgi:3-hydroxybutyryl-CoA dehydrogenase
MGLDTVTEVARSMHEEFAESRYPPPPLLLRMVNAGLLGRRTGHGFYEYAERAREA